MLDAFKSLPDDPAKLKGLVSQMDQEITSLTYQVEKLKAELAGYRKARFGSKSESLDRLALDLQDDEEIKAAAEAQQVEQSSGNDEEVASNKPRAKRKHNRTLLPDQLDRQDAVLSPGEDCGRVPWFPAPDRRGYHRRTGIYPGSLCGTPDPPPPHGLHLL